MIKFYTNQQLAQKFNVRLTRWKRWSREFLRPDPLGGLQSGYARQYNPDEAFTVFLGGYLVGDMKFTIPEARQILQDLSTWLAEHGFYFDFAGTANPDKKSVHAGDNYRIAIVSRNIFNDHDAGLSYLACNILAQESFELDGIRVRQERFTETSLGPRGDETALMNAASYRVLNISTLRRIFISNLQKGQPTE